MAMTTPQAQTSLKTPLEFPPSTPDASPDLEVYCLSDPLGLQHQDDGQDVIAGLSHTPKSLSPRYFYDDRGSELFEQICDLPEYYPTRTEAWILQTYGAEVARLTGPCELVELGSGSSTKTRQLLEAYQALGHPLRYVPIDVSAGILQASALQLRQDYPQLQIQGLVGTYEQALAHLDPTPSPSRLLFFLGSSIGNFDAAACDRFIHQVVTALQPGEYFLLGLDLQKPKAILEAAYDDSQGVTAAFNVNVLSHLNWRYQGNFDPSKFEHWSFYNEAEAQVEMHLRCLQSHVVTLDNLGLTVEFAEGETIHTEISRKFNLSAMETQLQGHGLTPVRTWTDDQGWFGLILCQADGPT
ncbi:L-histidine N(alpha)-methyltransferase [Prochlorothrix hollandica]|uniref:L-histidine N(alpha)-methyltransferase n=1 Tax=Prochlorothrix hollandica TaxID=1223 RepID=UPI00034D9D56|nr:L-histidine N(alpha)-methyltransferase [Prochlorothrix hollandica]